MPDWPRLRATMRGDGIVDGRNIFDKQEALAAGFRYRGIGKRREGEVRNVPVRAGGSGKNPVRQPERRKQPRGTAIRGDENGSGFGKTEV